MTLLRLLAVGAIVCTVGCTRIVVGRIVPALELLASVGASKTDLDFMGAAMPASLLDMEAILALSPDNTDLIKLVAEARCGYALGWIEDVDSSRASQYYKEGKELALDGLYKRSRSYRRAIDSGESVLDAIRAINDEKAVPLLFQAASCWGAWSNVNRNDPRAVFELPSIVAAMNKVIELDPTYFHGGAYLFLGAYYSGIPAAAGGGLAKGKSYFGKAFAISGGRMLMVHYMYAKSYAAALRDLRDPGTGETGVQIFDRMIRTIEQTDSRIDPDLGLANAIAKRKAALLKARRDELFADLD